MPREQISRYFTIRKHYKLNNHEAAYENEDTGVYFSFAWGQDELNDDCVAELKEAGLVYTGYSFFLNLVRCDAFIWEAEPELTEFLREFPFQAYDPGAHGTRLAAYTAGAFVRTWRRCNGIAYVALIDQPQEPGDHVPALTNHVSSAVLRRVWEWNRHVEQLQEQVEKQGGTAFVPRLRIARENGRFITLVVWAEGIPIVIPETDRVLFIRNEDGGPWFSKESAKLRVCAHREVLALGLAAQEGNIPSAYWEFNFEVPPKALTEFVRSLPGLEDDSLTILSLDQVSETEMLDSLADGMRDSDPDGLRLVKKDIDS